MINLGRTQQKIGKLLEDKKKVQQIKIENSQIRNYLNRIKIDEI